MNDREIMHKLLDYVMDNNEESGLTQYSTLDENLQLHIDRYRIWIKIDKDDRNK